MEAYDKIEKNYWGVSTTTAVAGSYNLPNIFELSLEKVTGKQGLANPTDRASTAKAIAEALKLATSTEMEMNVTLQTVAIALYNLQPVGRDSLFTSAQEKTLRDEVANVNPTTHEVEPTVFSKTIGKTLYLNVTQIAPQTLQEIGLAVDKASTTPNIDSMILDFRGNIGGAMDFGPAFLGLFIGQDQYALDLFSHGEKQVVRTTLPKYPEFAVFKEVAVLTDDKTQSTAELTTNALKQYNIAKSVGTKSKGWGTIENTYPMETEIDPDTKYTLLLVNSLTVRDDNQPIEGNGVLPDVDTTNPSWPSALSSQFKSPSLISALRETAGKPPIK
jgi:C-terminal processing protease CtpA/Prc